MKDTMDEIDPRKELFDLINCYGFKVVQVSDEILEVDFPNLACMFLTLHVSNTCFSDIVKMDFVKNIVRGSNVVHRVFCGKIPLLLFIFPKIC